MTDLSTSNLKRLLDQATPGPREPGNPIDRAVRLIELYGTRTGSPRDVALELAAAGLLAPDLPQPNPEHDDYTDFGNVWIEHDEPQRIYTDIDDLTPEEAEALGLALLAAANHAREHDAS